jgi:hypothetical protein
MQQEWWEERLLSLSLFLHRHPFLLDSGRSQKFQHILKIPFSFSDPWFEFRNAHGSSPLNTKDVELLHNYAIQYLKKFKGRKTPYWNSTGPLVAIKPKLIAYLEGIDFRLKLLEETPRLEFAKTTTSVTVKGLFSVHNKSKTNQGCSPQAVCHWADVEAGQPRVACRVI